jgi:hypothetical protein
MTTFTQQTLLSSCHHAPVVVVGGEEGTNHHECTRCSEPCDLVESRWDDEKEIIARVKEIIDALQDKRWVDHDEAFLIAAQGKLATYQANLAHLNAMWNEYYESLEMNAKRKEDELYLAYREAAKATEAECKARSRLGSREEYENAIKAKRAYTEMRGLINACETIVTAIQVHLRNMHREAMNTRYQNNT